MTVERLVTALGLERRVEFSGFRPDTATEIRTADVVVIPSRYDGMALSLLEAMACGAAIVATRVSGTSALGDTGLLVPPEDPTSLAEAIDALLADPQHGRLLGAAARKRAIEHYSLQRSLQGILGLWQGLGVWPATSSPDGEFPGHEHLVGEEEQLSSGGSSDAVTPQRVARILWQRKLICIAVAAAVFLAGVGYALARPKTYQSVSSVALLPVSSNPGILPNYPNLIASLIPTYVQLVSSAALLDQVAATLPFTISETQLAQDVHAQSLSNAAVINIVAQNASPLKAQQIAARATTVFLSQLNGNGVIVPKIYAQPTVPTKPAPPSAKLLLGITLLLAIVLGLAAGLLWDRLIKTENHTGQPHESRSRPPILGIIPESAADDAMSMIAATPDSTMPTGRRDSLRTNFMYATAGRAVGSVSVTSLSPGHGKTVVAVNLAVSLAEIGLAVVLVDADMGNPTLHEVFGIDAKAGLYSGALQDDDLSSLLSPVPSVPGLQLVTGDPQSPIHNGSGLDSDLIRKLCRVGDLIIVDSPPLRGGAAADTVLRASDEVLLVAQAGHGWTETVAADLRILKQFGTHVLGTVLTSDDLVPEYHHSQQPVSPLIAGEVPPTAQPE